MVVDNCNGMFCAKTHMFTRDANDVFSYLLGHPEVEDINISEDRLFVRSYHVSEAKYYEFLNLLRAKFVISNFKQEK